MKKKMTIWLLALLLILSGCGAAEGTEPALPDSPDGIVSEEVVQQPQTDITDSEENEQAVGEETEQSSSEPPDALPEQTPPPDGTIPPENSTFEVHYIDVGQGDSSLVLCDGKAIQFEIRKTTAIPMSARRHIQNSWRSYLSVVTSSTGLIIPCLSPELTWRKQKRLLVR